MQTCPEDASNKGSGTLEPPFDTTRSTPEDSALLNDSGRGSLRVLISIFVDTPPDESDDHHSSYYGRVIGQSSDTPTRFHHQFTQMTGSLKRGEELSADSTLEMKFRNDLPAAEDVEAASLRVLVSGAATGELRLSALAGAGPRASLALDASFLPRWADLDLGPRAQLSHLRLRAHCPRGCHLRIERAVLNVVAAHSLPLRPKRDDDRRRTDCYSGPGPGAGKRERCCRHEMQVVFRELPGYEFIIQPYGFDAGFCKGACPYRFNPANHHSSLQSLLWRQKKGSAPRPCCAPSKLDRLEILHLDESDPTRLKLAKWTNMKVTECACF
ncbi:hypothetical protein AAG570_013096 [Ranatra chinensis]|uniref:TGF-beta family profile domain-containing protein n=1 Tax=Ranatra chinensis TaxID=642074 RepID=A0ABD0YFU1_9HEMI